MLEVAEELLSELGLARAAELLGATIWAATQQDASYLDFLTTLLGIEREERRRRSYETLLRLAGLPHRKGLGAFDFDFATGVDRSLVNELASCAFVANAANVVLLGPPGVGKTHLAVGLALRALEVGHSVYFATMHRMVADLETMGSPRRLRKYLAPKVLVIDAGRLSGALARSSRDLLRGHLGSLRDRQHHRHLEQRLPRVGHPGGRPGACHRHPGPPAAPRHGPEHPGRELPVAGADQATAPWRSPAPGGHCHGEGR